MDERKSWKTRTILKKNYVQKQKGRKNSLTNATIIIIIIIISGIILHTFPSTAKNERSAAFHHSPALYALLHEAGTVWYKSPHNAISLDAFLTEASLLSDEGLTLTSAHVTTGLEQHGRLLVRADNALLDLKPHKKMRVWPLGWLFHLKLQRFGGWVGSGGLLP